MSKKQVVILWIVAGLLTAALAAVRSNSSKSPDPVTKFHLGDKIADSFPPAEIAQVVISDHAHTATLEKGETAWTLAERKGYPVNLSKLSKSISALRETEVAQAMEAGPRYNPRFGMDDSASEASEHGTWIRFLDGAGEELYAITLGKQTAGGPQANPMAMMSAPTTGRYVRTGADPESVYVVSSALNDFSANPTAWLAEDFIKINEIKSITLRTPGDESVEPWTATRETAQSEFTLEGLGEDEEMITSAASGLKNLFRNARFEDVVDSETIAAQGDQTKAQQAIINTFDGFTYTMNFTPKKPVEEAASDDFNPSAENYFLTFTVTAQLPEARVKGEDETEEESKKAEAAFLASQKELKDKLAGEQKLQGRAFEIAKWGTTALLKTRSDLVQKKAEETPAPGTPPAVVSPPVQIPMARPE